MADERIEITVDDVLRATTYTPLQLKEVISRNIAALCIEPVEIKSEDGENLPPMFRENRKLRQQYQMGILASLLGKDFTVQKATIRTENGQEERDLAWCMDEDDYNLWASAHVMNQLERLKKSKSGEAVVNKIFDLLYDYKAIEMMLSGAIRDELEERNDIFNRAMQYFSVTATQAAMSELMNKELPTVINELRRKGESDG